VNNATLGVHKLRWVVGDSFAACHLVLLSDKKKLGLIIMTLTIVASHWKEDLTWLKSAPWPVVLIDKEGADPSPFTPQHIIPNYGLEASSYLKYIVENYDELPDHVAFIHGHETSVHQNHDRPLLEVIQGANIQKYEFIPIDNSLHPTDFTDISYKTIRVYSLFDDLDIPAPKPRHCSPLIFELGAQFIVGRQKILRNPKELYEKWFNKLNSPEFSKEGPIIFEHLWHVIFGEPFTLVAKKDWFLFDWTPKLVQVLDGGALQFI